MTTKSTTTIRLDAEVKKSLHRIAKDLGVSFSQIVNVTLGAVANGDIHINMNVSMYPDSFAKELHADAEQLKKDLQKGTVKKYSSAKTMFDDILER